MKKNILLIALASERYYRNPLLPGCKQFFCGPDATIQLNNKSTSVLRIEINKITGGELMQRLRGNGFVPDITFIKADATCRNLLRGIKDIPGKKVLLMGDTHHMESQYKRCSHMLTENHRLNPSEHDRHHLKLFSDSGLNKIIWLPCFTMNPHRLEPKTKTDQQAVFVGSLSSHHQYRRYVLEKITASNVRTVIASAPQKKAAELYNKHSVSINVSLNGDLNFRIMEVLAAGGCLVTDRLGPDSGLKHLLKEGVHYMAYSTPEEAAEKISWLQENPTERFKMAQAGHSHFWETFSPKQQVEALLKVE